LDALVKKKKKRMTTPMTTESQVSESGRIGNLVTRRRSIKNSFRASTTRDERQNTSRNRSSFHYNHHRHPSSSHKTSLPRQPPARRHTKTTNRRTNTNNDRSATSSLSSVVELTLIFLVGSFVVHPVHGPGRVVPPPKHDMELVRVLFDCSSGGATPVDLTLESGLRHDYDRIEL